MLTSCRFNRKAVKKAMALAFKNGDKNLGQYYDSYQGAIKILMNSTYGQGDAPYTCMFDNIGPSVVTFSSRSMIQYCRDAFTHTLLKLPNGFDQ